MYSAQYAGFGQTVVIRKMSAPRILPRYNRYRSPARLAASPAEGLDNLVGHVRQLQSEQPT